jgi:hypothetical protein
MANTDSKKISEFSACNSPAANNLLVLVGNTSGTANTFRLTVSNLLGNSQANIVSSNDSYMSAKNLIIRKEQTPGSNSDVVYGGSVWWDANYLYVAIANNTIKRVPLETFT